jgi:hypothetical protein
MLHNSIVCFQELHLSSGLDLDTEQCGRVSVPLRKAVFVLKRDDNSKVPSSSYLKKNTGNGPGLPAVYNQPFLQPTSDQLQTPQVYYDQQTQLLYNSQFPPLRTNIITTNQTQLLQSIRQIHQQAQPAHMFNANTNQILLPTLSSISNRRSDITWSNEDDLDVTNEESSKKEHQWQTVSNK